MKISIDISQTAYEGTGVARYMCNLIASLIRYDTNNVYTFFFSSLRRKIDSQLRALIQSPHRLKQFPFPPTLLDFMWNTLHIFSIDHLIGKQDILLTSDWTEAPSFSKKITIVHDVVYLKFPETLPKKIVDVQTRRMAWVKKESTLILADSHNTKQDIMTLLKIPDEKIEVLYPSVKIQSIEKDKIRKTLRLYSLHKPFILTVGTQQPRKNMPRLISAFKNAHLKNIDLVIVGQKGWGNTYKKMDNVRYLGYMKEEALASLYSSALFFIYPSLYEGFGLPVVEAMNMGCPVATSNTSSLKEIGKDSCLLFNPNNTEEITQSLLVLYSSQQLRHDLIKKGLQRALDFSEKNFACQLIKIFEKIYDHRS